MRLVQFSLAKLLVCVSIVAIVLTCAVLLRRYIGDVTTTHSVLAGQLRYGNDAPSLSLPRLSRVAQLLVKKLEVAIQPEERENAYHFLRWASHKMPADQKKKLFRNLEQAVSQGRIKATPAAGVTLCHFLDFEIFDAERQDVIMQLLSKRPLSPDAIDMQLQLGGPQHHQAMLNFVAENPDTAIAEHVLNAFSDYTWPPVAALTIKLHGQGKMSVEELAEQASILSTDEGRATLLRIAFSPQESKQDRAVAVDTLVGDAQGRESLKDRLGNTGDALGQDDQANTNQAWFLSKVKSAMLKGAASRTLLEELKAASSRKYWYDPENDQAFDKSTAAQLHKSAIHQANVCQRLLPELHNWYDSDMTGLGDYRMRATNLEFLLTTVLHDPQLLEMSFVRLRIQFPKTGCIPDSCVKYYVDALAQSSHPELQIAAAYALLSHAHKDHAVCGLIGLIGDTDGGIASHHRMLASNLLRKRFGCSYWLDHRAWSKGLSVNCQ